jgi:hypothetical protein
LLRPTEPRKIDGMDANVIAFEPRAPRRRIVRRTAAPVIEMAPVIAAKRERERLDQIACEVADLMNEARRIRRNGGPRYPDGPGTAVAL